MKWKNRRKSSNVEDRRGMGAKGIVGGGIGTIIVIALALFGFDVGGLVDNLPISDTDNGTYERTAEEEELADFVSVVLADTEEIWADVFEKNNLDYENPKLVLFTDRVNSACGLTSAAVGPFYCPGDKKVYIDLSFYNELQNKFGAKGDFAMAYVIAHEVGHHVQKLLGISDQVAEARSQLSETEFNKLSVKLELQADYLAGVWAHHVKEKGYLDEGDIDEALNAANAIGDDTLQKKSRGYVVPDSFTHGTSKQRRDWFYKGYKLGTLEGGDTFTSEL
ncbi:KPN_02809 family neutral zinc metallopeptidase [Senegalia sp. (in: firmicutes)]|uniref:KPN_02809 family neutral zinc metallopeptidase n=1 Tax=Senegalia sp. (in: firmicutes) TaxID=1924098 RepID=UPI003F94FD5A